MVCYILSTSFLYEIPAFKHQQMTENRCTKRNIKVVKQQNKTKQNKTKNKTKQKQTKQKTKKLQKISFILLNIALLEKMVHLRTPFVMWGAPFYLKGYEKNLIMVLCKTSNSKQAFKAYFTLCLHVICKVKRSENRTSPV